MSDIPKEDLERVADAMPDEIRAIMAKATLADLADLAVSAALTREDDKAKAWPVEPTRAMQEAREALYRDFVEAADDPLHEAQQILVVSVSLLSLKQAVDEEDAAALTVLLRRARDLVEHANACQREAQRRLWRALPQGRKHFGEATT